MRGISLISSSRTLMSRFVRSALERQPAERIANTDL